MPKIHVFAIYQFLKIFFSGPFLISPTDCADPGIYPDGKTFYLLCKTGTKSTTISRLTTSQKVLFRAVILEVLNRESILFRKLRAPGFSPRRVAPALRRVRRGEEVTRLRQQ